MAVDGRGEGVRCFIEGRDVVSKLRACRSAKRRLDYS